MRIDQDELQDLVFLHNSSWRIADVFVLA